MNRTRRRWAAAVLALAALGSAGCGGGGERPAADRPTAAPAAEPRRVICGSPAVTEIVFALGRGDRVVGVSDYAVYPPEAAGKPRIGGWIDPNRERLLMLDPDMILSQGEHASLASFAEEYEIPFVPVVLDGLDDLYGAVETIAARLGVAERGADLNASIRAALRAVRERRGDRPARRAVLIVGRSGSGLNGLSAAGPGTFLDDLLAAAGGTNCFSDARGDYPRISKESLLLRDPEVIVELQPGPSDPAALARLRRDWEDLSELSAWKRGRIVSLTNSFLMIPGPRVGESARILADALHPDLAAGE
jgi:iron complex transport system substrate-binding protein